MYGERIRKAREELGITQEHLANKIGVSVLQINRYERDKNQPTSEILAKLSQTLSVSSDYLIGLTSDAGSSIVTTNLSSLERVVISALRSGDRIEAVKAILNDEG